MWIWFAVLLSTLCFTTSNFLVAGSETCFLDNRSYEVGETWHPTLKPLGIMHCINCTCQQGGKVDCVSEKCPKPKCKIPEYRRGQCCPMCIEPVVDDDVTVPPLPGCDFNGVKYEDSDVFPSNKTGLKPTRNDQCVMCVCSMGHVLCHLKTCLPVKCAKLIKTYDDCCPQCEDMPPVDEVDYEDDFDSILSDPRPRSKPHSSCRTMGYDQNSTSWHPVVGIFGEMKCITCRCLPNGKTECRRETCPPDDALPCKNPKLVEGECCKSCPGKRKRKKKNGKKGRRKKKRNRDGKKKHRKKPDRDKRRPQNDIEVPEDGNQYPCLPRRADRYVYTREDKDEIILAFKVVKTGKVEVTNWTVNHKGRLSNIATKEIEPSEFGSKYKSLELKGATNERHYKKLQKKLKRKLDRCKTRCRKKIVLNLVKRMKIKTVKFSAKCRPKL